MMIILKKKKMKMNLMKRKRKKKLKMKKLQQKKKMLVVNKCWESMKKMKLMMLMKICLVIRFKVTLLTTSNTIIISMRMIAIIDIYNFI